MRIRLENILNTVAEYYDVPIESVYSRSRKLKAVKVRQIYFYLAFFVAGKRVIEIGDLLDNDHATVVHGKTKIQNEIKLYPDLYSEIQELTFLIKPKNKMVVELCDVDLLQASINYTRSFIGAFPSQPLTNKQ